MKQYKLIAFFVTVALLVPLLVLPTQAVPLSRPDTSGAVSVLIYNLDSDSLVFSNNADKKVYPASTVKIMVALVAIEYFETLEDGLDTPIAISKKAVGVEGLTMKLRRGETLRARDLIAGMVIYGANDAAHALAIAIDGNIETFLARMNRKAAELGMKNTDFYNVSGLDIQPSTTANDLLILGKKAFECTTFMELAGTTRYQIAETDQNDAHTLYTRNYLLSKQTYADYYYAPATGMNAGATELGGYCIVSSARIDNQNYLCIVMGAKQFENFTLAKSLFEWASKTHSYRTLLSQKDIMGEISVALGNQSDYITIVPDREVTYFMQTDLDLNTAVNVETELYFTKLTAPVKAGLIVGEAIVYLEGEEIARVNLVTASALSRDHSAQLSRRIRNFIFSPTFLWIVIILVVCVIAYVLITARIRYLRMVKQIMEVPEENEPSIPPTPKTPRKNPKERS